MATWPLTRKAEYFVPFRTWRNTNTGRAAAELSELFGCNIPLRWSISHLYRRFSTMNRMSTRYAASPRLPVMSTGSSAEGSVLGIGDASGMLPHRPGHAELFRGHDGEVRYSGAAAVSAGSSGTSCLKFSWPETTPAASTVEGAALLDVSGRLKSGIPPLSARRGRGQREWWLRTPSDRVPAMCRPGHRRSR